MQPPHGYPPHGYGPPPAPPGYYPPQQPGYGPQAPPPAPRGDGPNCALIALVVIVSVAVLGVGGCLTCMCMGTAGGLLGNSKPAPAPEPTPSFPTIPVRFSGRSDASVVRIGDTVALRFSLRNTGTIPIKGFSLTCLDCDEITIVGAPAGSIGKRRIEYFMTVAPGAEVAPVIVIAPQKPGNIEVDIDLKGTDQRLEAGNAQTLLFKLAVF